MSTEIRGVVTRATGSWYDVLHEGRTIACRIRGRIRLKGVRSTNPVVVGDEVVCTEGGDGEWVIERILPRRNYIIRRASNLSKESHIIAANIDQALLVATLSQPTSLVYRTRTDMSTLFLNFCIFCICCNYSKQISMQDCPTHAMQAAALPGAHTPRHPLNTHRLRSHLQNSV